MLHDFELITDNLNKFTSNICFKDISMAANHISYYYQLLSSGLRGHPEAWVDMRVVVGSPQGYTGRDG